MAAQLHDGHLVRVTQTHRGLPVIGTGAVLRLDALGRIRWHDISLRDIPRDLSLEPTLSPREVITRVGRQLGYSPPVLDKVDPDQATRLIVYSQTNFTRPRLAYHVELPLALDRLLSPRAFVDAHTGNAYRTENRIALGGPPCDEGTHRAYVYPENPVSTPALACISLANQLAPGATQLINDDIIVGNCVDTGECRSVPSHSVELHWCDESPIATRNATGDFTDHGFVDHRAVEDAFAEIQLFYHTTRGLQVARSLGGFNNLATRPMRAIANFRLPVSNPLATSFDQTCTDGIYTEGEPLKRFENALFLPAGDLLDYPDSDALIFGQGANMDFSYDGDVVYHELGHAIMETVAPEFTRGFMDEFGWDPAPRGLHEGFADLHAMFVTGSSKMGEYVGGGRALRDLNNTRRCPDDLIGRSHNDSALFTGAVWEARTKVAKSGANLKTFDAAVFAAQQALTATDSVTAVASKIVAETATVLGSSHAATVRAVFDSRGLYGCNNRIVDGTVPRSGRTYLGGNLPGQQQPGPIQFRYPVPRGAESVSLHIGAARSGANRGRLELVGKLGEPIQWTMPGGVPTSDHSLAAIVPTTGNGQPTEVTIPGPIAPGTLFLQLVAGPDAFWRLTDISISHVETFSPDARDHNLRDAGASGGEPSGCNIADNRTAMGLLGLVIALTLLRKRCVRNLPI